MGVTRTLLSFEEFEQLPEQPGKSELLRGELLELPPAKLRHYRSALWLYQQLDVAIRAAHVHGECRELGEACIEAGYRLSPISWVQPDVSVTHARQSEGDYFLGAPAIAIEILSPSN